MEFDDATLEVIESLAMLELDASEREELRRRLSALAPLLDTLEVLEPLERHALDGVRSAPLEEDLPSPPLGVERALANAPSIAGDRFDLPPTTGLEE